MKILVACEESQAVCKEFRAKGHEAYSCDIIDHSGEHDDWHIKADVIPLLNGNCTFRTVDGAEHTVDGKWDMIIGFPPCTYITNAGARWLFAGKQLNKERYIQGLEGAMFLMTILSADCDRIAVENPVPNGIFKLPKYTQTIQPYEYGHGYSKKTCLWLRGLNELQPTQIVEDHVPYVSSGSYSKTHDPKYKGASRKGGAAKQRSKTFTGIAKAMAEQWGEIK